MYIVGITGLTGSGKSTVSDFLRKNGYPVVDADSISHKIILKGNRAYTQVIDEFGAGIISENGEIDRKALGRIVFNDSLKLDKLNSIMHPLIVEAILEEIEAADDMIAFIDAPLLSQVGLDKKCDEVWIVTASREKRLERIAKRDSLSINDAESRVTAQKEIALNHANVFYFENNDDRAALLLEVMKRLEIIEKW